MSYILGAQPSPRDDRDYMITRLAPVSTVFEDRFELPIPAPKNQNPESSCVAHSLSYARAYQEFLQTKKWKVFSVGFIYANRLDTDLQDEGMYPREALSQLQKCGDVLQEDFPFNENYPSVKARLTASKDALLKKAYPNRISAYAKLLTKESVKSALKQLGYVTVCMPVFPSFYGLNATDNACKQPGNEQCDGYHMVTIFGWDDAHGWKVLNSWGPEWGKDGWFWMPYDYAVAEMWSMTDNIKPQPDVDPAKHIFYRVHVGKFTSQAKAWIQQCALVKAKYKCTMEKLNGYYTVQVGAYLTEAEAKKMQAKLLKQKIKSTVVKY